MRTIVKPANCYAPATSKSFFDEVLDSEFFNLLNPAKTRFGNAPAVNIFENEAQFEFSFAIPGINKSDLQINFENNVLTVSSEIKKENEEKKDGFIRREFSFSNFKRSFNLGDKEIDHEKIEAEYTDGVLKVVVPKKAAEQKPNARTIEIK